MFGGGYFALSIGGVLSSRADKAALEFILGPSLGLLDNKVFITVAFHAARVESLAEASKFDLPSGGTAWPEIGEWVQRPRAFPNRV